MDKKLLKEKNLYEAHKQFMRLCEWSYVPSSLEEDEDEEQPQDPNAMGGDPNMMGGGNTQDPNAMGGDPNMMGGAPQGMPQDPNMMGGGDDASGGMPQDPNAMGGDTNMMGGGDMPPMGEDPMMGGDMGAPEEENEVIDVEDITNAQEKMNSKVNSVGKGMEGIDDKIGYLLKAIDAMQSKIEDQNAQILDFKKEFEKRNPTQTEKLNLRSLDSYPFNVNPKEYWEKKGEDPYSNYSAEFNNSKPTTDEYTITNSDVDDFSDGDMEKSFEIDDDLIQDIKKIFGM